MQHRGRAGAAGTRGAAESQPVPIPFLSSKAGRRLFRDLREYRPGDSLHEIHWKLSAKTDKLIVREAEEPNRGLIVLSFDFSGSRAQLDSTLRQLLWLSGWLTDREVVHQIDWLDPDTLEPQTKQIRAPQDLQELLRALLQTHLTGDTPTIAQRLYPNADWRYHIQPAAQEVSV